MKTPDRRRTQRVALELSGTAEVMSQDRGSPAAAFNVFTRNLCVNGAYLISRRRLPPGTGIQLHLHWPYGLKETDRRLEAVGNVVRVQQFSRHTYGLAVSFVGVPSLVDVRGE